MKEDELKDGSVTSKIWVKAGEMVEKNALWIVIATILVTILLLAPLLFMTPDRQASGEPDGEVFDILDKIDEKLPPANMYSGFILEADDGDVLTQEVLWELYQNELELRNSEFGGRYLVSRYDVNYNIWVPGIYTVADAVEIFLRNSFGIGLENAIDDQVKFAIYHILQTPDGESLSDSFSVKARTEKRTVLGQEIDAWTSPALLISIISDTNLVENVYVDTISGNPDDILIAEHYNRELQDHLRGDEDSYRLWGIAIDLSLEANDEGALSFPLIFAAVILILIIVTIIFRSPKVLLLTFIGLGMLIVWLMGLSNLVGLNSSLTIDILVPVSILVLGVDYAIHSVHRYEEERVKEKDPRKALGLSVAGVGAALFLAMVTTVVAFGSNAISEIEEIIGFGVSASMAIISAFWIMGFFLPAAKMLWDNRGYRKGKLKESRGKDGKGSELLGKVVLGTARKKFILLPIVVLISLGAGYLAIQLDARLDAKDYFDPSSDFVVSLDKLEEHTGDEGGEPAIVYIEGDLSNPPVLIAMKELEERFDDNENIAKDTITGEVLIYADIFHIFELIFDHNYTLQAIETANPGVNITDEDGDGIPDSTGQLKAVLGYMYENGLPLNETVMMFDVAQIREIVWRDPGDDTRYATFIMTGVPDTRELATVQASAREIEEDMEVLDIEGITYYGLTGSGYARDATLTAITETLTLSIGVAVILCFIILVILLRSFKYALVTVIPEILVAAWLYAFMYLAGFSLNAVTATIAAISIGVGIDYSVHVTARFRQELKRLGDREKAMEYAAQHSGVALLGSAASTMFGFAIIAFAPMPMFSAFGILTAIMILMAFVAALLVLPSLLFLVTPDRK
ncbi:MAG: efflux RND transporter permease subunit [Thermoplasmatota archaeon]